MDIMGVGMWKTASNYADTKLPAGITAPIATTLKDLDAGADGVLNLMTLNCSVRDSGHCSSNQGVEGQT